VKFFIVFLLFCFFSGLVLRRVKTAKRGGILVIACLLLTFAYYFLNQL
jgi:hypothetical protein